MIALNNKLRVLYAAIAVFIVIKSYIALQPHAVLWDEAVYYGMGKFIYSFGSSGLWESIRPIGLPIILGAIWKLGLPAIASEILMALFAGASALLTYLIAKILFNNRVGLLAGILFLSSPLLLQQSSLFLTEIPSTFFALLSLYLVVSNKLALSSLAAGVAVMFKFPHAMLLAILLIIPVVEWLKINKHSATIKKALMLILPFSFVVGLFLVGNYIAYADSATDILASVEPLQLAFGHTSNPAQTVDGVVSNALFYIIAMLKQNIFYAFLPLGLFVAFKLKNNVRVKMLLSYFAVYLLFFTLIANKQERFMLLFFPIAAIFAAVGIYHILLLNVGTTKMGLALTGVLLFMATFASISILDEDIRYINERSNEILPFYDLPQGTILASEPHAAYYTDERVIPYYFSTADGEEGIKKAMGRYEKHKEGFIIHNNDDFYCQNQDTFCMKQFEIISAQK